MDSRSLLTNLFIAGGALFLILTAIEAWGSNETLPSKEFISTPDTTVNLKKLTSRPLGADSALHLGSADLLLVAVIPTNYGCSACSQQFRTFVEAFKNHPSFQSLSTKMSAVIAESNHRVATHFARIQQLGTPVFQTTTVPTKRDTEKASSCSALLVDPQTETVFFKVHLTRARVTVASDAVFEAARDAYREQVH